MEDRIRIFLNNYINGLYFPTVHLTDVIEILIITVIVYEIMLWIKNTKAWMLLKGMIMLGAFFLLVMMSVFLCSGKSLWLQGGGVYSKIVEGLKEK